VQVWFDKHLISRYKKMMSRKSKDALVKREQEQK